MPRERATTIAIVAKQDTIASESLALWRKLGGKGPTLNAAEATLALRRGDERDALRQLNSLMSGDPDTGWRQALGVLTAILLSRAVTSALARVMTTRVGRVLGAAVVAGGLGVVGAIALSGAGRRFLSSPSPAVS